MNKAFSNFTWENDPSVNTPLSAENLNRVNKAVNEIDNRVISHDTTKANQVDMLSAITNVTFDESTGKFTFIRHNGTMVVLDTKLEKLILNWRFDNTTQILYMVLEDGSEMPVDLSAFITNVEFVDSTTIRAVIGTDGKVAFEIIDGSITGNKLEPNYLADVQLEATKASQSATNAQESADNAEASAVRAEEAAQIAQSVSQVDIATTTTAGIVKPDGTTITVDADGTIHGVASGDFVTRPELEEYAKEEDLANYLPLDGGGTVKKASMLPLYVENTTASANASLIAFRTSGLGNIGSIGMNGKDTPAWINGAGTNAYKFHHEGNKPSGSYTGNGNSASRTISTGGIGKCILIMRKDWTHFAIVTASGGLGFRTASDGQNIEYLSEKEAKFVDGVLTLATTNGRVNASGYVFEYQVL